MLEARRYYDIFIILAVTLILCLKMALSISCTNCGNYGYCAKKGVNDTCDQCKCPARFNGNCCEIMPPPGCNANPCPPENYTCINHEAGQYRCDCEAGNTGASCNETIDPCEPDPCGVGADACYANGTETWSCECGNDYTGNRCETFQKCNKWCTCVCNDTLCKNGGTCAFNGCGKYQCFCPENYDGTNCQYFNTCLNQTAYPCQHGGICDYKGNGKYSCDCLDIWQGKNCEYFNACNPNPCANGARCENSNNSFICRCAKGWQGKYCTSLINMCNPMPCKNGAKCTSLVGDFNCSCPCGAYGKQCENREDFCHDPDGNNYCQKKDKDAVCNNGFCDYTCTCSADWTDANCTMMMIIWNIMKELGPDVNIEEMLHEIIANPFLIKDLLPFMLAQLPLENQTALSWDYEDLFVWAAYEKTELNIKSDIVKWYQTSMGNCFTFNHDNSSKLYNLRYSDQIGGFDALMRVRQDEYLSWVDTASLILFIHPIGETIMAESVRYQAGPGEHTSLFVKKTSYARLGQPYGICVKEVNEVTSYYYSGNYSVDGCFRSCYQDAVQQACGCMDPRYPKPSWATACALGNRNCVLNVTTTLGDPSTWDVCFCPQPCNEETYEIAWTSTIFRSFPIQCNKETMDDYEYSNCTFKYNDMAMISVSFPRLTHKTVVETPKMTFNDILTRIGNYLGLICGVSVCTIVEFGFLLYRLFIACCTKKKFVHQRFYEKQ